MILLTVDEVMMLHDEQIATYGGDPGLRDAGLLDSAVASFDGVMVHSSPAEIAGAYLFHLARNHAFVDGNKRVALATALVFLDLTGLTVSWSSDDAATISEQVATGELPKSALTVHLATAIHPRDLDAVA